VSTRLVVLAAGVGSRYGGLKQLDAVGPGGATLMDYTIFDALAAGVDRVVLIVRRETEPEIRAHVGRGAGRHVVVDYVYQELEALPDGFRVPEGRVKPWGTGHALLTAAEFLEGPFVVANADDFYGREAITALCGFLGGDRRPERWAMVGYRLGDTLPASGAVSRALCLQDDGGTLLELEEAPSVELSGDAAIWTDEGGERRRLALDQLVSMNLWGFTPRLLGYLERGFRAFLRADPGPKDEYYLPVAVGAAIRDGGATVEVLPAGHHWCGMTSRQDRGATAGVLSELVEAGEYPERLWE
jgi:hypothetical protein